MKINLVGYGEPNILWCTARKWGITFKLALFFDTEEAYVVKNSHKNFDPTRDYNKLYKELKASLENMDFKLMTPRKRYLQNHITSTANLLHHVKQIHNV